MENLISGINDMVFDVFESLGVTQTVMLDGAATEVIFDGDLLKKRQDRAGMYIGEQLMYVRTGDIKSRPEPGKQMRLDRRSMVVTQCVEQDGMYEITLAANNG